VKNQKGFAFIEILVIIILIVCLFITGIIIYKREHPGLAGPKGKLTFNMNLQGEFVESNSPCPYVATYSSHKSICIDPDSDQINTIQTIIGFNGNGSDNNAKANIIADVNPVKIKNNCFPALGCNQSSNTGYTTYLEINKIYSVKRVK
jgi:hypothetical protein